MEINKNDLEAYLQVGADKAWERNIKSCRFRAIVQAATESGVVDEIRYIFERAYCTAVADIAREGGRQERERRIQERKAE